jgi:hypothetical protein
MGSFRQAARYITALMSDLPRKNGWTIVSVLRRPRHFGSEFS